MKTAYPNTQTTCSIRLYSNIPFDNTYKNHSLISSKFKYSNNPVYGGSNELIKESFINRKDYSKTGYPFVYPRYDLTGEFNFNFSNGLVGSVVLELTAEQTNANYLRLATNQATPEYYYYFITGISQVNADTYQLSLELDVIMTYQDEFLEGMKDVPVFASRKHCHRYDATGLTPYCADLKTGDDVFSNVKPSIISSVEKSHFYAGQMKKLEGINWLYVCLDFSKNINANYELYNCKDITTPLLMMAIPLGVNSLTYRGTGDYYSKTFTNAELMLGIKYLINNGSIHGAKILPFPPFAPSTSAGATYPSITYEDGDLTIESKIDVAWETTNYHVYQLTIGNNKIQYGNIGTISDDDSDIMWLRLYKLGFVMITEQNDVKYQHDTISFNTLGLKNSVAPTIVNNRYLDPKLLFSPFKKYVINSQYSSSGNEIYPELSMCDNIATTGGVAMSTTCTAYIGDNNFYTNVAMLGISNYVYEKIGLTGCVNYLMPCGENALDVFNTTQAQSFYTSKVASGITSGLTIAGGIASVGTGIAGAVGSLGISTPISVGLIATGSSAIASGIAGISTTIASANAKKEDLLNTPDTINISGSNAIFDNALLKDTCGLPYIVTYDVTNVVKENANDYFYNYGYQVARECYFNTELYVNNDSNGFIDNNLFGRTIFNYIQLNEDITNKINANIPLIIKQKLSTLFNQGITIWNYFGFYELWADTFETPTSTYYIDNWFMKCILDNTEYYGNYYR